MRKQLFQTVDDVLKSDKKVVLLFGDVGTYGFRQSATEFPNRVYNVGILEQSMVGMAAGLAMQDFIPIVHTISTFLVERSLEQIKNDFGYQNLGGNFIGTGASYDLSSWGPTHQCPGDIGILKNVPEVEIVVPGTASEFDSLFKQSYANGHPTYFRISAVNNVENYKVKFGKANIIQKGKRATIIAVGPMLDKVKEACEGLDVTILYYTTLQPFDRVTLRRAFKGIKVVICEPYYMGALAADVSAALKGHPIEITHIGMSHEFPHCYGTVDDLDKFFHLTIGDIKKRIKKAIS